MARVTVEDCIVQISSRFKLVMIAAQRSRELSVGGELTIDRDNDKNPVVALREIAELTVDLDVLETAMVQGLQKNVDIDEPNDEAEEFLAVEEALSELVGLEASKDDDAAVDENAVDENAAGEDTDGDQPAGDQPDMGAGFEDEPGLEGER